jgi:hypothetical protein
MLLHLDRELDTNLGVWEILSELGGLFGTILWGGAKVGPRDHGCLLD